MTDGPQTQNWVQTPNPCQCVCLGGCVKVGLGCCRSRHKAFCVCPSSFKTDKDFWRPTYCVSTVSGAALWYKMEWKKHRKGHNHAHILYTHTYTLWCVCQMKNKCKFCTVKKARLLIGNDVTISSDCRGILEIWGWLVYTAFQDQRLANELLTKC